MTHPNGRQYTIDEKRAILAEARETAQRLLVKIEQLAAIDRADELRESEQSQ